MGSRGVSSMAGRCCLRDQRLILSFLLTIATESKGQKLVINRINRNKKQQKYEPVTILAVHKYLDHHSCQK